MRVKKGAGQGPRGKEGVRQGRAGVELVDCSCLPQPTQQGHDKRTPPHTQPPSLTQSQRAVPLAAPP